MSELTDIKVLSPEVDVLSVLSSPEPQAPASLGGEDSAGDHQVAMATPLSLLNRYKSFDQPLSQEEIEDLYQDAIKLPPKEQERIAEELRAILVFRNIAGKQGRVLGQSGKINGLYIANWDLVAVPFERPCPHCVGNSLTCEYEKRLGIGRKKCRECRFGNATCWPQGQHESVTTPRRRESDAEYISNLRPPKRLRTSTTTSSASASGSPSTSKVSDPMDSFAHLSKETLLGIIRDQQGSLADAKNQLQSREKDMLIAAKDKEISELRKQLTKAKKDLRSTVDEVVRSADALKAKYAR
ncbi:hypothetical protein BDZ89DRAFT_1074648 [Hymenopellis radicata]|nr:hypothetical protein BDZ89DRAFT_1074648 [Hymenopellis radicata]